MNQSDWHTANQQTNTQNQSMNDQRFTSNGTNDDGHFSVASAQALGHRYEHNEDSLFVFATNVITSAVSMDYGCICVADGMGGYDRGEVASAYAVQKMGDFILRKILLPILNPQDYFTQEPVLEVLESAMRFIHDDISTKIDGGGTTLTTVVLMGDYVTIAHIGDSRAYLIDENGSIERLTEDQTLVQRLVSMGQLTEEEARTYPQRNVLYYALGRGDQIEPFLSSRKVKKDSCLIVCSDGLWEIVDDRTICDIAKASDAPQTAANRLVQYAMEHGAMDNVSVVVGKVH